jgi:hypothetical protein
MLRLRVDAEVLGVQHFHKKAGAHVIKTPLERAQEFAQDCIAKAPVIILGSGASAAHGIPGMWPLAEHLKATPPVSGTASEDGAWLKFVTLLSTTDLEAALTKVTFTERLTRHVIDTTRAFLLPHDEAIFGKLLANRHTLPLSRLISHLFKSTHKTIDIVTPNYDRIAEYAADAADVFAYTGFTYGYLNSRSRDPNMRVHQNGHSARTVSVWKVHGSLDWFKSPEGQIYQLPSGISTPLGYTPVMITPGVEKYRLAYEEPFRTVITCADAALEEARSFLCVGFGFNDDHLQTKLVGRCEASNTPIVVISKSITDTAKKFLFSDRCRRFLALEHCSTGTRMYSSDDDHSGVEIDGCNIWQLDDFLDSCIGVAK